MCSLNGNNTEQEFGGVLDNGLIIKTRILRKNKGGPWENSVNS